MTFGKILISLKFNYEVNSTSYYKESTILSTSELENLGL